MSSILTLPYFFAYSSNKDFTFTPTIFDKNMQMLQTEYREVGRNFNLITDFGFTKGYVSSKLKTKKNLTHFFGKLDLDLNLDKFSTSKFFIPDFEIISKPLYETSFINLVFKLLVSFNSLIPFVERLIDPFLNSETNNLLKLK